jgi:hypothetical protein
MINLAINICRRKSIDNIKTIKFLPIKIKILKLSFLKKKTMSLESFNEKDKEMMFWAKKFRQHFHYIGIFIVDNAEKLEKYLLDTDKKETIDDLLRTTLRFEKTWNRIYTSSNPMDEMHELYSLLNKTYTFKKKMEHLFSSAKIPCAPALMRHMMEEVEYVSDVVINESWSYVKEMAWWAQEHAENLGFVNCELPRLMEFKKIKSPKDLLLMGKIYIANKKLIKKFSEIKKTIDTLLSSDKVEINDELYHKMMKTKVEHIKGIKSLIKELKNLPLGDEKKSIVKQMLIHEAEEAKFSFYRLGGR